MNPIVFLKKPIVLFVIAILALVIIVPWAMPSGIFDDWNTSGDTWSKRGLEFGDNFNKADYVGSWLPNMDSETFTITGMVRYKTAITGAIFTDYRYALYVDGSSEVKDRYPSDGSWIDVPFQIGEPYEWYYLQTWSDEVKSNDNIRLKVVLEVKIYDYFQTFTYSDPTDLAWDGAYLKSGRGEIYLPAGQLGPFEEGETVNLYVRTGFTNGAGWYVKIYPPVDNPVSGYPKTIETISDDRQVYVHWTVPSGAFQIGSTNEWRAELWNQYFDVGFEQLFTIDQHERAPVISSVIENINDDSVTFTVNCNMTYAALSHIIVYAWYGEGTTMPSTSDTEDWVQYGLQYPVSGNQATFNLYPKATHIDGTIIVKIILADVDGRTSTPSYSSIIIDGGEPGPGPDPLEQPFVWTTTALLLAVLIVLAIIALMFFAPVGWDIKIIMAAVIGIAGAALVWLAGTLQGPFG